MVLQVFVLDTTTYLIFCRLTASSAHLLTSVQNYGLDKTNISRSKKNNASSPWRTLWWSLRPGYRRRFLSAWPGPLHSRWGTPSFPQWERLLSWLYRRRWWWGWKTTKLLPRFDLRETWGQRRRGWTNIKLCYLSRIIRSRIKFTICQ